MKFLNLILKFGIPLLSCCSIPLANADPGGVNNPACESVVGQGNLMGWCNTYCVAQDCTNPNNADKKSCDKLAAKFAQEAGYPIPCLQHPDLALVKTTNNDPTSEGDLTGKVNVSVGNSVQWKFALTNTGNVDLSIDSLIDSYTQGSNSGNENISCPSAIPFVLPVGQSVNCTASGSAAAGLYNNNATVSAHDVHIPTLTISKQAASSYMGTQTTGSGVCPQGCMTVIDNFFIDISSRPVPVFASSSCFIDSVGRYFAAITMSASSSNNYILRVGDGTGCNFVNAFPVTTGSFPISTGTDPASLAVQKACANYAAPKIQNYLTSNGLPGSCPTFP